eukprot:COSAG02_NODE_844_length_16583_cov_116.650267_10_plen_170_part_00
MDETFDHAPEGERIADKLTAIDVNKAGLLKFSDGAYIIETGEFRCYTSDDYVCLENTFGYPFPGREHDDEAMATLQQMYRDTCLDNPEMIQALTNIETLCMLHQAGKQVFLMKGSPDSGKTTMRQMISLCTGLQYAHGPGTYWTTNRDATKPDEHKSRASGKTVFSILI